MTVVKTGTIFTTVTRTVDCSVETDVKVIGQLELVNVDVSVVRKLAVEVTVEEVLFVRVIV